MDAAFIGIGYIGTKQPIAVYSKKTLLAIIAHCGVSAADAEDYYNWHFSGLHAGANTPVIIDDVFGSEQ